MLYKRFFYINDYPAIVCINEQKLDGPVRVGQCDFLFDETTKWEDFLKNKPLAFCIGFHKSKKEETLRKIENLIGFDVIRPRDTRDTHQAIIVTNEKFRSFFELEE